MASEFLVQFFTPRSKIFTFMFACMCLSVKHENLVYKNGDLMQGPLQEVLISLERSKTRMLKQ